MRQWPLLVVMLVAGMACDSPAPRPAPPAPTKSASADGMCAEHGVPEALCTKCNPALAQVFKAKGDWCPEHGFPESFCPVCNPNAEFPDLSAPPKAGEEVMSDGAIEGRVVRLQSEELEGATGITTTKAIEAESGTQVECSASISFDNDKVADIRAIVPGIVREIEVELGDSVTPGDPLFVLESTEIGEVQGQLQSARERVRTAKANLDRKRALFRDQVVSQRDVEVAEQAVVEAEARVRSASSTLRVAGASRGQPSGRYVLDSPIAGDVVRRPAVLGALATEASSLALIADTSTMWAMCELPEREAALVSKGHLMQVETATGPVRGEITWISPEVDARTRMVSARAVLDNENGKLRANQFAKAKVLTGAPVKSVTVPRAAVQRIEGREVVFVRASAGTFLPRVVERFGDGAMVAVKGKVNPGDDVVVEGAVLLRTEVIPGSIGAGCCEPAPGEEE